MAGCTAQLLLAAIGDEDEPCLRPGLFLKERVRSAGLLVLPATGHAINLEEPAAFHRAVSDFLTLVEAGRWPVREAGAPQASALLPERDLSGL